MTDENVKKIEISLDKETTDALKVILEENLFSKLWNQVVRTAESNCSILNDKVGAKVDRLVRQGRRELNAFFQEGFSSSQFDLDAPFASKDEIKKLAISLKGITEAEENGENIKTEPTKAEKTIFDDIKDNKLFQGLLMLDKDAVIKEYERVVKDFDDKIGSLKSILKSFTKLNKTLQVNNKENLVKALSDWCLSEEGKMKSKEILLKTNIEFESSQMENITPLELLKERFGDVVYIQAIDELVEDMTLKVKKYRKRFKILLSDVIYKSSHVNISFEKFQKDMSGEAEFSDLAAFNSKEIDHCKAVFEEYMESFRERKLKKRKLEQENGSNKKPRSKSRSNSSEKEDGEIPDD